MWCSRNTLVVNPSASNIQSRFWEGVFAFRSQTKNIPSPDFPTLEDNSSLGKQPRFNHSESKYMNSCSQVLITDARRTASSRVQPFPGTLVRVMTIVHAASSPRFVARLATHARDSERERKAIVFNHPRGEICLENHLHVIDDSCGFLFTSLSGSSDTFFYEHILWGEISEL